MSAKKEGNDPPPEGTIPSVCHKCGGELFSGYGLAGGGFGAYAGCDQCGTFYKVQDPEEQ